ncbi:MAG: hypothetical protein EA412_09305 [Chitinophagaceae bacterium]|nr:MAG: hypothetical protein EA412_09305 [Chitinophagaceae bacterium]
MSYPIVRFGVQAGVHHEINESRLLISFTLTGLILFAYLMFKCSNSKINFNENFLEITKINIIGKAKSIIINNNKLNYIVFDNISFKFIEIYENKKRLTKISPTDFGKEKYQLILEQLKKIKDEGLPK